MSLDEILYGLTLVGLVVFSLAGVLTAHRKRLDLVGACAVAIVTAFGGGTVRDLLLGRLPVFWVLDQKYALIVLGVAVIAFYTARSERIPDMAIQVPDALGLGLFAVVGAATARQVHAPLFVAALMGTVTAVFGGVLRDIIVNEIPEVFGPTQQLYATCAFIGAFGYLLLIRAGTPQAIAQSVAISGTFAIRIAAMRFNLTLPPPRSGL